MNATTEFIVGLFLLLSCAVIVGEIFGRLGQLPMVGQLLVGIVLGPTLLGPALGLGGLSSLLAGIQILATFFILMAAGLAVSPEQVRTTGGMSAILGVTIFAVPFALGTVLLRFVDPGLGAREALFVALTISITALPVLGVMLREFGLLGSRFGTYLLNGSLINELLAVTVFAVLLRERAGSGSLGLALGTALVAVGLFLGTIVAAQLVLRVLRTLPSWHRLGDRIRAAWRSREAGFAVLMVAALGTALYSQYLGLTYLIGAFYAGLLVTPENAGAALHRSLVQVFDTITWGFFIPLFFALVGLSMDLKLLGGSWELGAVFAALCLFAFAVKLFLGAAISRSLGWSGNASLAAGFLVTSRGAVELAMAVVLLADGVFSPTIFTMVAGVGLVTTFLAPMGARPFVRAIAVPPAGPSGPVSPA